MKNPLVFAVNEVLFGLKTIVFGTDVLILFPITTLFSVRLLLPAKYPIATLLVP